MPERKFRQKVVARPRIEILHYGFYERYGRQPIELAIFRDGEYEVGPFGHDGFDIQFGSRETTQIFDGAFSATVARSLKPGSMAVEEDALDDESALKMKPLATDADFDLASSAITESSLGTITHFTGQANRVRIVVTGYDPGTDAGVLVAWIV